MSDNYTKSISLIGEIDPLLTSYESSKDNLKEPDDILIYYYDKMKQLDVAMIIFEYYVVIWSAQRALY